MSRVTKTIEWWRNQGTSPLSPRYIAPEALVSGFVSGTTLVGVNAIAALPFVITRRCRMDEIGMEAVIGLAASSVRLGLYRPTSPKNLYPGSLLLDAGVVSTATSGYKTITISQILDPGLYYAVLHLSAAVNIRGYLATGLLPILGWPTTLGSIPHTFITVTQGSFGALPDPYPSGGTLATTNPGVVFYRLAAP